MTLASALEAPFGPYDGEVVVAAGAAVLLAGSARRLPLARTAG